MLPMEILRNIARHKLRSLLTISGILIGVLALTTMGALAENFNALIDGGVKYYGGSIQVGPPDGQAASLIATSKIDEIKQIPGVAAAFPAYQFSAKPGQFTAVSFGIPDLIIAGDDEVGDAEAHGRELAGLGRELVGGERGGHAGDLLDLVDLARRDQGGGLAVGRPDLDAAAVVLDAAVDEGVEVLRERAHRGQREHADEDSRDGEQAAQLVARDVAEDFHGEHVENRADKAKRA